MHFELCKWKLHYLNHCSIYHMHENYFIVIKMKILFHGSFNVYINFKLNDKQVINKQINKYIFNFIFSKISFYINIYILLFIQVSIKRVE